MQQKKMKHIRWEFLNICTQQTLSLYANQHVLHRGDSCPVVNQTTRVLWCWSSVRSSMKTRKLKTRLDTIKVSKTASHWQSCGETASDKLWGIQRGSTWSVLWYAYVSTGIPMTVIPLNISCTVNRFSLAFEQNPATMSANYGLGRHSVRTSACKKCW